MNAVTGLKRGRVVQGAGAYTSQPGSVYAPGISAGTVGAQAVFLGMVTIPPGGRTKAHLHKFLESAFYLLSGEAVELCTGARLEHRETARAGDYLVIPANLPHVAVNRGNSPAVFVGVRNEPMAQESVVMLPPTRRTRAMSAPGRSQVLVPQRATRKANP